MTARNRTLMVVAGCLAALMGYWLLVLGPKRDEASQLGEKVAAAQTRLDDARTDLSTAEAARATYASNYSTVARLGKAVPAQDEVPSLVYQLDSAATASSVDFRTIKLTGQPTPAAAAPAKTPSQTATAKSGDGTAGSTPAPATPAPATQTAVTALPPGAAVGPAGFPSMPFSFAFNGSFFRLEGFLRKVQQFVRVSEEQIRVNGRLLTIDGIALTEGSKGFPQMKAAIAATAFLLPTDQGLTNGATATAPAATQPVSTTASGGTP